MLFYADRISDNIRKREPEGYLICVNVPIARSGTQQYLQDEIGQSGDKMITVYRPEEEVFSKATMASFEGMPVTNDHPNEEEGVTAENIQYLQKGHCQNVRRGTGPDKDLLIADLIITDPTTIQEVLDGKREISCGYNYQMDEEDGKYTQRQIRGNHIAIVDKGRAGHRVCIKDSAQNLERRKSKMAKNHNGILAKMLAAMARDASPEEIEEAVDAIEEITSAPEPIEAPEEPVQDEEPDKMDMILEKLATLEEAVAALKGADCKDEEPVEEDPLKKLEEDLDEMEKTEVVETEEEPMNPEEDSEEPESQFVDPEEINEEDADPEEIAMVQEEEEEEKPLIDKKACDAARIALNAVKPLIAKLPPEERKQASDAAIAQIRKASGLDEKPQKNGYVAIKKAKKAADRQSESDIGRRIMEMRNPHYQK